MDGTHILQTMRAMAWERAKGELQSILHGFYSDSGDKFNKLEMLIDEFVSKVEDDELY